MEPVLDAIEQTRFTELMQQSYRKVFNLAYRLAGNRPDAEDLTQEAFFRAYRGFRDYEGDRPFENWIFRIASRLFLDLIRSRKRRVSTVSYDAPVRADGSDDTLIMQTPDTGPSPEDRLLRMAVSEHMEAALRSLKPDQRILVLMADVEGLPYSEIAAIAGVPVGTVRSRLHRAHKRLKSFLEAKQREAGSQQVTSYLYAS